MTVPAASRLSASAENIADGMRRRKYFILILFSIFYFGATCFRASKKLFWFDELFTVYVSRLPDMAAVWKVLKQGVDLNPPVFYALTRLSESLFGEGHIATRLPEIVGFWILCVCLFRFVSARASVLAATISMLFPLVTTAYFYAYDARAHGIVLGCSGLALLSWQAAIQPKRSSLSLAGLTLALTCATLTHTYAILLLVPFYLAEIVRALSLKRADWSLWMALIMPAMGTAVSLPLYQAARATIPPTAFPASVAAAVNSYQSHLGPVDTLLFAALVLYFAFGVLSKPRPSAWKDSGVIKLAETVVLLGFVAMPVLVLAVAKLTGAPYNDRYSISMVAGFGSLFGILAAKKPAVGLGVLALLVIQIDTSLGQYAVTQTTLEPSTYTLLGSQPVFTKTYGLLRADPDRGSPIVLLDQLEFLPLMHYAPPDIASRLVYAASEIGLIESSYVALRQCCGAPGRFEKLTELRSKSDRLVVLASSRSVSRLSSLIEQGADVTLRSVSFGNFVFSVDFDNGKHQNDFAGAGPAEQ